MNKEQTFQFHINAENDIREVTFRIDNDGFSSSCTCGHHDQLCWHRYYVLAGKMQRLPQEELKWQKELIRSLSKTKYGSQLIEKARHHFGEKETCRRCNSSNIIELNKSFYGRFIKIFLKNTRKFYCRSCRWSW